MINSENDSVQSQACYHLRTSESRNVEGHGAIDNGRGDNQIIMTIDIFGYSDIDTVT